MTNTIGSGSRDDPMVITDAPFGGASSPSARRRAAPAPTSGEPSSDQARAALSTQRAPVLPSVFLPSPTERVLVAFFAVLLVYGSAYGWIGVWLKSGAVTSAAPSYFARKDNFLNVFFVKIGWFWTSLAAWAVATSNAASALAGGSPKQQQLGRRLVAQSLVRWGIASAWWFLVTQWCFGPALIDRGFTYTGGSCVVVLDGESPVDQRPGGAYQSPATAYSAIMCKASGGSWSGGHDISGHVFLLVLATSMLLEEVGWSAVMDIWRRREKAVQETSAAEGGWLAWWKPQSERVVRNTDGSVMDATAEGRDSWEAPLGQGPQWNYGTIVAGVHVALSWWMLLMTAMYFHTWIEKLTGLVTALAGWYVIYVLPRWVPIIRQVVGMPGI